MLKPLYFEAEELDPQPAHAVTACADCVLPCAICRGPEELDVQPADAAALCTGCYACRGPEELDAQPADAAMMCTPCNYPCVGQAVREA